MLTVYGRATSSNVQAVMWAVGELGLDHQRLDYGHIHGGLDTPQFRAMNPHGRVPVLKDGDLVIWESCAILRYLAARYGKDDAFWPVETGARARVDMWAEWGKLEVGLGFTSPIFWPRVRTSAKQRDQGALDAAIARFDDVMERLAAQIGSHAYVCGDAFTLADIVIGHLLYRWFDIDIPRQPNPTIEAYYARLCQRRAYRDHVMVDYSPLWAEGA